MLSQLCAQLFATTTTKLLTWCAVCKSKPFHCRVFSPCASAANYALEAKGWKRVGHSTAEALRQEGKATWSAWSLTWFTQFIKSFWRACLGGCRYEILGRGQDSYAVQPIMQPNKLLGSQDNDAVRRLEDSALNTGSCLGRRRSTPSSLRP